MIAELAGEHAMPDGRKVQITVVEQAKTETEVSAKFENCWERVLPMVLFNPDTSIPTERNAKQLQAFSKLLVIMHDLNGGEWKPKDEEITCVNYKKSTDKLNLEPWSLYLPSPIYFRTRELAQKAREANEQIFRDFYGI
jgi:hypothetical protein